MNSLLETSLKKLINKKIPNPHLDLRILLKHSSFNQEDIILSNFDEKKIDTKIFYNFLKKRLNHEPISKIIKRKQFWKYSFIVNKNVHDPRPETENIIEESLKLYCNKKNKITILDIGTGSGCISISLAKEFNNSIITAIDVSKKALEVANKNTRLYQCKNQIKLEQNKLNNIKKKFDLIVCNPPYLSKKEYEKCSNEIKKYEPKIAFVGGIDGLKIYRNLAQKCPKLMKKNSYLVIEIGKNQLHSCKKIFKNSGLILKKVKKDLQNIDRTLIFEKI